MDELPELLLETVGGETVLETVDLGGGDVVAITPARTHLYRADGLLSDESVETFGHDTERFAVDSGRRKSTLRLQSIDDEESFTVPNSVVEEVIAAMLEGLLQTTDVLDAEERIEAQFRFSELTLVVTDRQLLKHIGSAVWDEEFETFRYEDVTDLTFEEGSVATQVVVEADGRQQRVKVPNENAGRVRQAIQTSIFEYHGVSSLGGLREAVEKTPDDTAEADSNLTASEPTNADTSDSAEGGETEDGFVSADWSPPADQDITREQPEDETETASADGSGSNTKATSEADSSAETTPSTITAGGDEQSESRDIETLTEKVDSLTEQVERQTELIEAQQETIEQLVEELRRGR